jgi:hypothetical protein
MRTVETEFFARLHNAGMPTIPDEFSVVPLHQEIPKAILAEIDIFIDVFDRVTTRAVWQDAVTAGSPKFIQQKRSETCFFSALDLHLPAEAPENWQLIEFNDNASGFIFAELINRTYYEIFNLTHQKTIASPPTISVFTKLITDMVETEAKAFFGRHPPGMLLILDDADSLQQGIFHQELRLLQDLFQRSGWQAELCTPTELFWDGKHLRWQGREVAFIVNRSTDFLWQADCFTPLRAAYQAGPVYVAPNPFTFTTRSDKRLLEFLSRPDWDLALGIQPQERAVLSSHVPETYLIREDNLEDIVQQKETLFFKPTSSYASRGIIKSTQIGRTRLRRLLAKNQDYVAQKIVPKSPLKTANSDEPPLWTDLRVWAYHGQRFMLSGRASRDQDSLDLNPPGGWLPTYALK